MDDFKIFRENTVGYNERYKTPYGIKKMFYADWTASGRLYRPIEDKIVNTFGPFVGNTHSESNKSGRTMTKAYNFAHLKIKQHVNANDEDIVITCGFGMTSCINKLQTILGLKICEKLQRHTQVPEELKPIVFVTHMEHHFNQTSWLETYSDVVCIKPDRDGLVSIDKVEIELKKYSSRKIKIGSFTACSNISGIKTPYHKMAKLMHQYGGVCFVDFASSSPYVTMDMHPKEKLEQLDAIFFSPHKFLGGPGSSGVLVFNSNLYQNEIPDSSGGGTVTWTNPWGGKGYNPNIELREDGGTPGFLQAIKTSLCISLKDTMNVKHMSNRSTKIMKMVFKRLNNINNLHILAGNIKERLGIFSFYIDNVHYNLISKILDERFGVQVRGGCSCGGTYGHYLLNINEEYSKRITDAIDLGDFSRKPGWVRLSIHPMTTDSEVDYIMCSIEDTVKNVNKWSKDYIYNSKTNEFKNIHEEQEDNMINSWFIF
ncbi:aminotransferase class V-fold PLP-dependent enzyme [Clostridium psychrophilum]|uniref:aminotransferase class V-fold PLP-dependent enzyme n=1 Tax=Clostridium psychrophilum TaxID=132926 RepID=UPI001C0B9DD8|nr:aminotransferase class V-fold PLP-dependent enzyme [Clostridium psychrophilum]MBU3183095.1 aminotransferase class V-fold PLP-dependent enzyme [Clostridium psychrophilum]